MRYTRFLLAVLGIFLMFSLFSLIVGCVSGGGTDVSTPGGEADVTRPKVSHDVIIVGGGISGLTSAYNLKDYNIKLLEKNDYPGGRTLSGKYKEYVYAKGTEYLGEPVGALKKIVEELMLKPVHIPSPADATYKKDTFYWGDEGLTLMHINESSLDEYNSFVTEITELNSKYDYLTPDPSIEFLDDITARDWFKQKRFSMFLQEKYNVSARGLFGAGIDEISALSYIPEIAFDYEDTNVLTKEEAAMLENTPEQDGTAGTVSFATGITEVVDALAKNLGDKVQLNSTVTSVIKKDDIYHVTYLDSAGKSHELTSLAVIMAVPSPVALKLAPELLNNEQKEIMNEISFAQYITVALFSNEPLFDKAFDLAVPDGYFFTDVYDSTWVQKHYAPPSTNKTYIASVYIAPVSYKDKELLTLTDNEILKRAYDDWRKIFQNADPEHIKKDIKSVVTGYDIHRFEYGYPVMTKGSHKRLKRLNDINNGSFLLAGDYMQYPTYDAAAETGLDAAKEVKEYLSIANRH